MNSRRYYQRGHGLRKSASEWLNLRHAGSYRLIVHVGFGGGGLEKGDTGGEAVDKALAADGSELAAAEEAGGGHVAEDFAEDADVVSGLGPHMRAPSVATEEHGRADGFPLAGGEHGAEVLVGAGGVADVELDGGTDAGVAGDADGAGAAVEAEDVVDEKVAAGEGFLAFVDDPPDEQGLACELVVLRGKGVDDGLKLAEGFLAAELANDVSLAAGDDEGFADRSAALRDDGANGEIPGQGEGDKAFAVQLVVEDEAVLPGFVGGGSDAADDGCFRETLVDAGDETGHVDTEGVGEGDEERRAFWLYPGDAFPIGKVVVLLQGGLVEVKRANGDAGQGTGEEGHGGGAFAFTVVADGTLGGTADEHGVGKVLTEACDDGFHVVFIMGGGKEHHQIDHAGGEAAVRVGKELSDGAFSGGIGGDGGGEAHGNSQESEANLGFGFVRPRRNRRGGSPPLGWYVVVRWTASPRTIRYAAFRLSCSG